MNTNMMIRSKTSVLLKSTKKKNVKYRKKIFGNYDRIFKVKATEREEDCESEIDAERTNDDGNGIDGQYGLKYVRNATFLDIRGRIRIRCGDFDRKKEILEISSQI